MLVESNLLIPVVHFLFRIIAEDPASSGDQEGPHPRARHTRANRGARPKEDNSSHQ